MLNERITQDVLAKIFVTRKAVKCVVQLLFTVRIAYKTKCELVTGDKYQCYNAANLQCRMK
jgi:hypothetical protein